MFTNSILLGDGIAKVFVSCSLG